ncbi:hypothetical protein [Vibrio phage vB_VmeM-Yong XC32]|nr:hypothetical protein [Vibrio phage vB_VmeM-Yong XC31]QAX96395.1 hypothetical protein [Vibrio phage vB_VmeM-Yong XC32]QAX96712.1 hypothetical protein [Vibrio phage vB_VmeM-Yong MS31]QAX97031.1 hypothetical protein [Vibrio phage vB_VmeM-Yong MS32]
MEFTLRMFNQKKGTALGVLMADCNFVLDGAWLHSLTFAFAMFAFFAIGSVLTKSSVEQAQIDRIRKREKAKLVVLLKSKLVYCPNLPDPIRWIKTRYRKTACSSVAGDLLKESDFQDVVDKALEITRA